ncbi:MAG: site-specific DNA-methyltransferase [Leptolyngbyaceae cyanobacterium MAG.088]|nr:site-specific DNA-methyltransferase [Leptolyngbyaceae cyanobacterium MAG.088]
MNGDKKRAPNNRTLVLSADDRRLYRQKLVTLTQDTSYQACENTTIWQDTFEALPRLPSDFVDLLIVDPPYNRSKVFNQSTFAHRSLEAYETWLDSWMSPVIRLLKPNASAYVCCDWQSSPAVYNVFSRYFSVRSRITWEREKGRGSKQNWKNSSEDIWFGTLSDDYWFDVEAVKLKRRVLAPYRDRNGNPKDWQTTDNGKFRVTHPSNLWTDISIPFWSMPENTDHPTQKPEKLLAKIILASSQPGDVVFDPFLGSGTTSVVAKKLGRRYVGIEMDEEYACIAEKRLDLAALQPEIQGYAGGYFWERNSLSAQQQARRHKENVDC